MDDENAALIAEHLEAAGDLHAAYGWHMRAARWATNRDIAAARQSWERAVSIADALPADDPTGQPCALLLAPCCAGSPVESMRNVAGARFDELRQLCTAAGDKASLAIGMAGWWWITCFRTGCARRRGWHRKPGPSSSRSAIRPDGGAVFAAIYARIEDGERVTCCGGHRRAIDLADGDPSKGNFFFGCPLAVAFTTRAIARYSL